jgi:hypothetical protein
MKMRRLGLIVRGAVAGAVVASVLALAAESAAAQTPSLGEVAKKEAERRKALPPAGKVYTNKDLPPSALKPAAPATGAGTDTTIPLDPVAAATADKPAESKPEAAKGEEKNEAWWKARMLGAREGLRRNEMFVEALKTRVNSLTTDFQTRDNPVAREQIGKDRSDALAELARVKQDIERSKKEIFDLEEEARKAAVPPGWLR